MGDGLWRYVQFATERLQITSPVLIEAGASRVKDFRLVTGDNRRFGPIFKEEIWCRQTLQSFDDDEIEHALLTIFEPFYDAAGTIRPSNLGVPRRR